MTLRRLGLASIAAFVVGSAGCSSEDSSATTTAVPTTVSAPTTSAPATTGAPQTSSTSIVQTTLPATTDVPTTPVATPSLSSPQLDPTSSTLYPPDDPRSEVEAANYAIQKEWFACLAVVPNCDTSRLAEIYGGDLLELNKRNIDNLQATGYHFSGLENYVETVRGVERNGDSAVVRRCTFDASVISRPDPAGGPDQVADDAIVSIVSDTTMEKGTDGQWRAVRGDVVDRVFGGKSLCAG